jgi:hypothetical protein
MPLLWPYAWLAFLTMCVAIAAAQVIAKMFDTAPAGKPRAAR